MGILIVKVKPLTRSPMANPDPQNARPEGGSYLEFWFCLLVFIEENRGGNSKLLIFIILHFSDRTQLVSARADTAGVRTWLDIGHDKSYDGTKMSYQKDTEG